MNYLIQKMFENRGYTYDYINEINQPDYDKLLDIDKMSARLKEIHDKGIVITELSDFDTDGIMSGIIGFSGLAELGFHVNLFIPDPSQGYGIEISTIQELMRQYPNTQVIITSDTGIGAYDAINYCHQIGVEILITDHHKEKQKSNADVIVNPMRIDETYSHPSICGAFVLYQILQHYADSYCNSFLQEQIRRLRVFAGIGTISDTMPLLYENRQLVRDASQICQLILGDNGSTDVVANISGSVTYQKAFWGLYYMLKLYQNFGVIKSLEDVDESFFGYYLAPTFNSVKRMNGDLSRAFSIFFGDTQEDDCMYLYKLNLARKSAVESAFKVMMERDQPYQPFIYFSDANPGILGLLATKIMTYTGVPTFVCNDEGVFYKGSRFHGSGRAPAWYPCIDKLSNQIFIAGHNAAFGWGADTQTELERLFRVLSVEVPAVMSTLDITEEKPDFVISTDWSADIGIDISMFKEYLEELESYKPFGKEFPVPNIVFQFSNKDALSWTTMGTTKQHLKISFNDGFDVLCWNQGHLLTTQKNNFETHKIVGHLGVSEFRGITSIVFIGSFVEQKLVDEGDI